MNKKIVVSIIICSLALSLFGALMVSSVRADTSDAKVISYSWYIADTNSVLAAYPGDVVVVGEVQNIGTTNLAVVDVGASAYNSSGTFLASSENNAFVFDLMPGQKAPFYIDITADSSVTGDLGWVPSATNITVAVINAPNTANSLYQGVSVTSNSGSVNANGLYTVTGTLTNKGNQTSGPLWVVATFYNSSGIVVSVNFSNELAETLASGASVPFTVVPTDNNVAISSQITNYSLLVQSQDLSVVPSTTPNPSPTTSNAPTPITTASTTTTQPTANTPHATIDKTTILIAGLALIVAVLLVVIALLLVKRRSKPQSPPPTESPIQTP